MVFQFFAPLLGDYRRQKGYYDAMTSRCFAAAWKSSGDPKRLLAYALFKRDMGCRLPARLVEPLIDALPKFSNVQRRLALGLISERAADCLNLLPTDLLLDGMSLPAVAAFHERNTGRISALAKIHLFQDEWRSEFADALFRAVSAEGVAVVGNAANLLGSAAGRAIDAHGLVVRFNHFMGAPASYGDVGQKTDVWVVAPGYRGPIPEEVGFVVMTGPDMRYRLADWRHLLPLVERGIPLLTVPLSVWRTLVRQLKSPPSAGVLVLFWLHVLAGSWAGLRMAGIGSGTEKGRYHAVLGRHAPSRRHDWHKEADLVRSWRCSGLQDLMNFSVNR